MGTREQRKGPWGAAVEARLVEAAERGAAGRQESRAFHMAPAQPSWRPWSASPKVPRPAPVIPTSMRALEGTLVGNARDIPLDRLAAA